MRRKQKQPAKPVKCRLKPGDDVVVITGKDKSKRGVIQSIHNTKVVVEGINMVKQHVKPNPQRNIQGGIVPKEKAIDISNIAIYNPQTKKADRVGFRFLEDGTKVRCFKSNGEQIDS